MKRLFRGLFPLLFFLIFTLSAALPYTQANADFSHVQIHHVQAEQTTTPEAGDYACILSDDVFFYANPDGRKGLFLLPKSYYVRLMEYRSDYCKVEYQTDDKTPYCLQAQLGLRRRAASMGTSKQIATKIAICAGEFSFVAEGNSASEFGSPGGCKLAT